MDSSAFSIPHQVALILITQTVIAIIIIIILILILTVAILIILTLITQPIAVTLLMWNQIQEK